MFDLVKFIQDICNGRSDEESLLLAKLNFMGESLYSDVSLEDFKKQFVEDSGDDIRSVLNGIAGLKVSRDGESQ